MKRKVIRITITLRDGEEVFDSSGNNSISSSGLAVSCNLAYGNGAITPTAQITIYGLALEKMLKLMRVQWNTMNALLNTIRVEVGEEGETLKIAYEGNITQATIDANSAPDIPLIITSQMAVVENMKAAEPYTSPKDQEIDAADIIKELCAKIGYEFENNGATHIVTNYTVEGSDLEKIKTIALQCDFDIYVEQKLIAICPKGGNRNIRIPILTPATGLQGYPVPDIRGLSFICLYDPAIRFGGIVRIADSIITVCNADWRIYGMSAQLEANIPNGKWHITANATWRDSKDAAVQR